MNMPRGARERICYPQHRVKKGRMMTLAHPQRKDKNVSFRSSGTYNDRMESRESCCQEEKNTGLNGHVTKGTL
jgi:hypothetical protein